MSQGFLLDSPMPTSCAGRHRRRAGTPGARQQRLEGWCPRNNHRGSSRRAARRRPESAQGRPAKHHFPSQDARRDADPRQREPAPAGLSRQGCRRSRRPQHARAPPRRRRSERHRREALWSANSRGSSWPAFAHSWYRGPGHSRCTHQRWPDRPALHQAWQPVAGRSWIGRAVGWIMAASQPSGRPRWDRTTSAVRISAGSSS